jgi:LPS export ABC transporter protein LptC
MHRLGRAVPVAVVLFVALVVAILVTKSRTTPVESAQPAPSRADLAVKQPEIEEESAGLRWRLKAEQGLVFDGEGRTALRKIAAVVVDKERTWTIVAEEGDVFQPSPQTRRIELRKNVVVTSNDGYRLETSVLRWQSETRRLWTDVPVRLFRDGTVIHGTTFEMLMGDETAIVGGPVHALFRGKRE